MSTSERARRFYAGESGAIMVMGIFMCSCLVGALWYLAGIGDAIVLRERAQEAADATAFSDAALHARGMNLIVLINLVMACILGVRVALKIARLVLLAAGAVFGALGYIWPPLYALAAPCMAAAQAVQTAIDSSREPINSSLEILGKTQDGIATLTPLAARTGTLAMIGPKYEPAITRIGIAHFGSGTLPISDGSQDKLCKEAGHAAGFLAGWAIDKGGLGSIPSDGSSWLGHKFAWIASTSPQHFCEIGSATGDPDLSELFKESAVERCKGGPADEKRGLDATEQAWMDRCAAYGVTCKGTDEKGGALEHGVQTGTTATEIQQAELDRLRLVRDQGARSNKERRDLFGKEVSSGDRNKCQDWAASDARRRQTEQSDLEKKQRPAGKGDSGEKSNITPKKVATDFHNGHEAGQIAGGALFDATRLGRSSRLVRVGAFKDARAAAASPGDGASLPSWAQAEFFFDCGSNWETCNADEDAMWHLKWRARLRRWNEPEPINVAIAEMGLANGRRIDADELSRRASTMPAGVYGPNPALREELRLALQSAGRRGVH